MVAYFDAVTGDISGARAQFEQARDTLENLRTPFPGVSLCGAPGREALTRLLLRGKASPQICDLAWLIRRLEGPRIQVLGQETQRKGAGYKAIGLAQEFPGLGGELEDDTRRIEMATCIHLIRSSGDTRPNIQHMRPKTADELRRMISGLENRRTKQRTRKARTSSADDGDVGPHNRSVVGINGSHLDITSCPLGTSSYAEGGLR